MKYAIRVLTRNVTRLERVIEGALIRKRNVPANEAFFVRDFNEAEELIIILKEAIHHLEGRL